MSFNRIPFTLSEEAFLLNSLHEVTKVWASATGKATFNLSVQDGQAHLQLGFQLGMPGDHHLQPHQPRNQKTTLRKERDRQRAAEHQAKQADKVVVPTTLPTSSVSETPISTSTAAASVVIASHTSPKVAVPVTNPVKVVKSPDNQKVEIETKTPEAVSAPVLESSAAASAAPPKYPPIYPCRPIRPFCQPEPNDPLKELPYFIYDLKRKVYFSDNKDLKSKHKAIAKAFADKVKEETKILYKSKNYEETYLS